MQWECKFFDELTVAELYQLLQLRSQVFVVEQNCVYLDTDGLDIQAWHVLGKQEGKIIAATRIIAPGKVYAEASIGRVVVDAAYRKNAAGIQLMQYSIEQLYQLLGISDIKIGAQLYLESFYQKFGFQKISPVYLEDGIEHIKMLKKAADLNSLI